MLTRDRNSITVDHSSRNHSYTIRRLKKRPGGCSEFVQRFHPLLLVLCFLLLCIESGRAFNIAPEASYIRTNRQRDYEGKSSYFGYSVALLQDSGRTWLLAGAPRANSSSSRGVVEPGALFKCQLSTPNEPQNCEEVVVDTSENFKTIPTRRSSVKPLRDQGWLGASIGLDQEKNVVVCAPRWKDVLVKSYIITGMCYLLGKQLKNQSSTRLNFLGDPSKRLYNHFGQGVYFYSHGQCGFDVHITDDQDLLIGAPGVLNWRGSVVKSIPQYDVPQPVRNKRQSSGRYTSTLVPNLVKSSEVEDSSFFGYSITSGYFVEENTTYYVAGAPRGALSHGLVLVFLMRTSESQSLYIKARKKGTQMGEYFGASVAAPDLNNDGFSDLVVGAPFHSFDTHYDAGCVYVFMNNVGKVGNLDAEGFILDGDKQRKARFGSSLGTPGDLDNDGFQDLVVGAPYEDDNRGAVYVFMGTKNGIRKTFSQKLRPEQASPNGLLKGFGISFSKPVDVDLNQYPDFAVGSFLSDSAVVMLTRPVIIVKGELTSDPPQLSFAEDHFMLTSCLLYEGIGVPSTAELTATISLNQEKTTGEIVSSFSDTGSTQKVINLDIKEKEKKCDELKVDLKLKESNAQNPVIVSMDFEIRDLERKGPEDPILNRFESYRPKLILSFVTGCNDDKCESDLTTFAKFKDFESEGTLLLGELSKIVMEVHVTNRGEPAFLPRVIILVPLPTKVLPTVQDCTTEIDVYHTEVTCQLENPLKRNTKHSLSFDLDVSKLDDTSPDIDIHVHANSSADVELKPSDNDFRLQLKLEKRATLKLTGWSVPEQFTYDRKSEFEMATNGTQQMKLVFSIEKSDITPLRDVYIEMALPAKLTTKNGQLLFLQKIENQLAFPGKSSQCQVNSTEQPNMNSDIKNDPNREIGLSRETTKIGVKDLNCSSENIGCSYIQCNIGPWKRGYTVATLTISFDLNFTVLGEIVAVNRGFSLFTSAAVKIVPSLESSKLIGKTYDKSLVQIVFQPGVLPAQKLAWWIYLLAILGGLILLFLIAFILYKVGFFRRKKKEELMAQQATQEDKEYT